jgi:hypothetical protein
MADNELMSQDTGLIEGGGTISPAEQGYAPTSDLDSTYSESYTDTSAPRVLQVPKHWDSRTKRCFNSLSSEAKKIWLKSFKTQEHSFNKIVDRIYDEHESTVGELEGIPDVVRPIRATLDEMGLSPASYFASLIQEDLKCTQNPVDYVLALMYKHNIRFSDLDYARTGFIERQRLMESLLPVQNKVSDLEQTIDEKLDARENAIKDEQNAFLVEQARDAVDADGNLLHPYFDELAPLIAEKVRELNTNNLHLAYAEAYNTAVEEGLLEDDDSPQESFRINKVGARTGSAVTPQDLMKKHEKLEEKYFLADLERRFRDRYAGRQPINY